MEALFTYWWFWVGLVLIGEGLVIFFLMGRYKYYRRRDRRQLETSKLIQQARNARKIGHHPCRFDGGFWHEGLCTTIACPPKSNRPKNGALYYANR